MFGRPVAVAADMTPNVARRDSYLSRFDRFNRSAERLREQEPADMCWPTSWPYFARVATLSDYQ
jgi:hypothetical protein